jgi:hypothetical protein
MALPGYLEGAQARLRLDRATAIQGGFSVIRTVARLAAVASVSVVMLGLAPATAPANTPSASLQFVKYAQLQTDGTVHVTVYYLCNPGEFGSEGFFFVELSQPGTFGSTFVPANCNDQKHKLTVDVAPGPFTPGTASARAEVANRDFTSFVEKSAELTVR